ncbi:MAG: hypothetical protein IPH60_04755 [Flavobacteriales bacterium]|nr:hypothetical protein [Flavobacteriales bacterium]
MPTSGVTPAVLADLQTAIDTYVLAIAAACSITERKGATAEIRTLLKDTNKLLTKRLDALVTQFTWSKAEFVRGYFDVRINREQQFIRRKQGTCSCGRLTG